MDAFDEINKAHEEYEHSNQDGWGLVVFAVGTVFAVLGAICGLLLGMML